MAYDVRRLYYHDILTVNLCQHEEISKNYDYKAIVSQKPKPYFAC